MATGNHRAIKSRRSHTRRLGVPVAGNFVGNPAGPPRAESNGYVVSVAVHCFAMLCAIGQSV